MSVSNQGNLGFLRTCIDKRFVDGSRRAFEWSTGLMATEYWHESYAGGSAVPPPNTIGEDYAAAHGATIFGWQAHVDNCGGNPGASNQQIEQRLDETIQAMLAKYPNARHFRILASEIGVDIREVFPRK
jgi:hypothetical protein